MNTILCFGEALIDFHAQRPVESGEVPTFVPYPGGAPANVAVAIARLGGRVGFVGMLGTDMFGDMLLRDLDAAAVDTRHARRTNAANTALAFVARDASGERTFSFYRPPSADLLFRDGDFDAGVFATASIFHTGSCSMTEPAIAATTLHGMRRARAAGALVSFDMNLRPALWPRSEDPTPRLWEALAVADLVKLSLEEFAFVAEPLGGEQAALERLWSAATRLVVVTDGSRPIRWFTRNAAGTLPSFKIRAVDCTGAGDAFVGGLLHGLAAQATDANPLDADSLDALGTDSQRRDRLLRRAMACGALAAMRVGSFAAMPQCEAVDRFLENQA